jgi:hypothetical protein
MGQHAAEWTLTLSCFATCGHSPQHNAHKDHKAPADEVTRVLGQGGIRRSSLHQEAVQQRYSNTEQRLQVMTGRAAEGVLVCLMPSGHKISHTWLLKLSAAYCRKLCWLQWHGMHTQCLLCLVKLADAVTAINV